MSIGGVMFNMKTDYIKLNSLSKERMEILLELSKMKEKRIKFNQQLLILDKKIGLLIEK